MGPPRRADRWPRSLLWITSWRWGCGQGYRVHRLWSRVTLIEAGRRRGTERFRHVLPRQTLALRSGQRAGAVTVLVSHRFSTVSMADQVLVLGDGAVLESGTHDELITSGGRYAELYAAQAAAYR